MRPEKIDLQRESETDYKVVVYAIPHQELDIGYEFVLYSVVYDISVHICVKAYTRSRYEEKDGWLTQTQYFLGFY